MLNMSLDYETAHTPEFTLCCFDTGGREGFATFTINVLPVNTGMFSWQLATMFWAVDLLF